MIQDFRLWCRDIDWLNNTVCYKSKPLGDLDIIFISKKHVFRFIKIIIYLVYIIDHIHHFFMNLKKQFLFIYKIGGSINFHTCCKRNLMSLYYRKIRMFKCIFGLIFFKLVVQIKKNGVQMQNIQRYVCFLFEIYSVEPCQYS
jgi:hypothetical protein